MPPKPGGHPSKGKGVSTRSQTAVDAPSADPRQEEASSSLSDAMSDRAPAPIPPVQADLQQFILGALANLKADLEVSQERLRSDLEASQERLRSDLSLRLMALESQRLETLSPRAPEGPPRRPAPPSRPRRSAPLPRSSEEDEDPDRPRPSIETRSPAGRRSPRGKTVPDVDVLTDGKDPAFDHWQHMIKSKLRQDKHLFVTQEDRVDYIFSRTGARARRVLGARVTTTGPLRIRTVDEALELLEMSFADIHKRDTARMAFRRLRYSEGSDFHNFCTEFTQLALESELAEQEYKQEFVYRMPHRIAYPLISQEKNEEVSYKQYVARASEFAHYLASDKRRQSDVPPRTAYAPFRSVARQPAPITTTTSSSSRPPTVGPGPRASVTPTRTTARTPSTPSTTARASQALVTATRRSASSTPSPAVAVVCYNCGKAGHYSKECSAPRASRITEIVDETAEEEPYEEEDRGDDLHDPVGEESYEELYEDEQEKAQA